MRELLRVAFGGTHQQFDPFGLRPDLLDGVAPALFPLLLPSRRGSSWGRCEVAHRASLGRRADQTLRRRTFHWHRPIWRFHPASVATQGAAEDQFQRDRSAKETGTECQDRSRRRTKQSCSSRRFAHGQARLGYPRLRKVRPLAQHCSPRGLGASRTARCQEAAPEARRVDIHDPGRQPDAAAQTRWHEPTPSSPRLVNADQRVPPDSDAPRRD